MSETSASPCHLSACLSLQVRQHLSSLLKAVITAFPSVSFSAFPCGSTALTADRCSQVLIVEDDNGEIVKEVMKDTDAIMQYKSM
eukprot:SAG22_NODE_2483_length_2525_cov_5.067601_5_plen_85_part_00